MASVTFNAVKKTYPNGFEAVRGVDLEIRDGEFIVLVGPSGCGKSTTLRMLAGLESVTSGEIRIGDRRVNDVAPRDRDIAMVFQNYALYPHMTVRKNLGFALRLRGEPRDEIDRRVAHAADLLGLNEMLERKPGQLSGGQRQRVAVGRAIVREPAVYLFDEPLSNLDAKLRASMRQELKLLHQRLGVTTVYVTHDQEEAMTLGDRVVVMDAGEIQQQGPPIGVYRDPASRFVASFIGSPRMNFFEGELARRDGVVWFAEKDSGFDARLADTPASASAPMGPATLGLRPQHLRLVDQNERGPVLQATIRAVDPLGEEMDLVFDTASRTGAIARVPFDRPVEVGDKVAFGFDPAQARLFDQNGARHAADQRPSGSHEPQTSRA